MRQSPAVQLTGEPIQDAPGKERAPGDESREVAAGIGSRFQHRQRLFWRVDPPGGDELEALPEAPADPARVDERLGENLGPREPSRPLGEAGAVPPGALAP